MKKIKVLVVGDFVYHMYEGAFYDKFLDLGYETHRFEILKYLDFKNDSFFLRNYYKFQYKFNFGPSIFLLNRFLVKKVKEISPDMIFIYRGKHITPRTLAKIKENSPSSKIFNYNNDDAFSKKYPPFFWSLFKRSIHLYDHIFCYRNKNITDLEKINYRKTSLLLPYYIKEKNYQKLQNFKDRKYQVVFIGHYEDDSRDEYIKSLVENDFKVGLFGTGWEKSKHYDFFISQFKDIKRLNGDSYNETLNEAKVALVFMSKLNSDQYTRRCFEIPATGAVMLSERTPDLMNLYEENKEIVFFDSKEGMLSLLKRLFKNESVLEEISVNAKKRLLVDKHELTDRINEVINTYLQIERK